MYTKKILSAATAVAIMSTGAMSFEAFVTDQNRSLTSNTRTGGQIGPLAGGEGNGTIMTELSDGGSGTMFVASSYVDSNISDRNITLSDTFKGDALIYPAFNQREGWGTEIVVRNVTGNAIVAKAVIYGGEDSHEVKDFNIYLSAKDVCRFTIEGDKITSSDGSIKTFGIHPHQVDTNNSTGRRNLTQDLTDYRSIKFANTEPLNEDITEPYGYVAIFGMEQSAGINRTQKDISDATSYIAVAANGFHGDHDGLYAAYAATLDKRRAGWRSVVNETVGSIKKGMFIKDVFQAPVHHRIARGRGDINATTWEEFYVNFAGENKLREHNATFAPVANDSLTGQVRIFNNTAGRDMLLNATAINNFTDDNHTLLWTEGEYASIADRCIQIRHTDLSVAMTNSNLAASDEAAEYQKQCIKEDAQAFMIRSAVYTYANAAGAVESKLMLTQPYKRLLAQLNNPDVNGSDYDGASNGQYIYSTVAPIKYQTLETGTGYNFNFDVSNTYDEDENQVVAAIGGRIITSPITTGADAVTFNKEVQEVNPAQLEKHPSFGGEFDNKNGFTEVNNIPMPAVTTEMIGSIAGPTAEMNWVYTDNIRYAQ